MEGKCKHGTFNLKDGCPQCIAEKRAVMDMTQDVPLTLEPEFLPTPEPQDTIELAPLTAVIAVKPSSNEDVTKLFWEAITLQEYAESRTIQSLDDLKAATADLNIIRKLKRSLESLRKDWLKPLQDHTKSINEDFAQVQKPILAADKATADKMNEFDREQARIRREQEEVNRLRIEAAEKEKALNDGVITESVDLIKPVAKVPEYVRTEAGNAGMRDVWKWEVTDFKALPDDYKKVDEGTLTGVVKGSKGKLSIPGVRIYNEPTRATRR